MVDETLKRLLDAEAKAEQIISRANEERLSIMEQAKCDARTMEEHHAKRVADIHSAFLAEAEQRAQQTIAALKKRHTEQAQALRAAAKQHEPQALDEAVALLIGTAQP